MTTPQITPLALFRAPGSAPAKKNITPAIIIINTATAGTIVNITNLTRLLIKTKKSQNSQAFCPSPPHGTKAAWVKLGARNKNKKLAKNNFFIIAIILYHSLCFP